jgi:hypothetical protein
MPPSARAGTGCPQRRLPRRCDPSGLPELRADAKWAGPDLRKLSKRSARRRQRANYDHGKLAVAELRRCQATAEPPAAKDTRAGHHHHQAGSRATDVCLMRCRHVIAGHAGVVACPVRRKLAIFGAVDGQRLPDDRGENLRAHWMVTNVSRRGRNALRCSEEQGRRGGGEARARPWLSKCPAFAAIGCPRPPERVVITSQGRRPSWPGPVDLEDAATWSVRRTGFFEAPADQVDEADFAFAKAAVDQCDGAITGYGQLAHE